MILLYKDLLFEGIVSYGWVLCKTIIYSQGEKCILLPLKNPMYKKVKYREMMRT